MSRAFTRAATTTLLATLLATLPGFTAAASAGTIAAPSSAAVQDAIASSPKIVIVVGATEGTTPAYRTDADSIYAEAIKYTPNVVRIYSPNATWAAVKAAAQGASVFVYLGHGYGFPSPYKPVLTPTVHDGMGLNIALNGGDTNKQYWGESYIASEIRLAKNAIVILNHLCYSAGSSETGAAEPTIAVAKERVDNFASGFLRAGARAVMADSWNGIAEQMIRGLFTTNQSIGTLWDSLRSVKGHDITWTPARNPSYTGIMDPDTATTGFHRSIVGNLAMQTDDLIAGASVAPTNRDPSTLQVPGAASVATGGAALSVDAALTTPPTATLPAGTRVRVAETQAGAPLPDGSAGPAVARVATLDNVATGWTAAAGLVPRDSVGPQLWAMDGATTITPNSDGDHDTLVLLARFSEPVTWTARILDPAAAVVKTFSGTADSAVLAWNPVVAGVAPPTADYTWSIHAADGWGNPALDTSGVIHLSNPPIPPTAVMSFGPTTPATTNATSTSYGIVFRDVVTDLTAADFSVTGTTGCVVGEPVGSGTTYSVTLTGCAPGRFVLTLQPGSVVDTFANRGPAGSVSAHWVLIDRTAPVVAGPKVSIRPGGTLGATGVPAVLSWTATDAGGAGIRNYDIAQSTDGGAFATIRSALPGASLNLSLAPGHTYRFEVRATDKASNRGAWLAGPTLNPAVVQQTTTSAAWAGPWTTASSTAYSGGSAKYSSTAGASSIFTFSGRSVGAVFSRGPARGKVSVYVDGTFAATIDLYAASSSYGSVAFARTFNTYTTHTLKLVVAGTSGRPTVVLDAFLVLH